MAAVWGRRLPTWVLALTCWCGVGRQLRARLAPSLSAPAMMTSKRWWMPPPRSAAKASLRGMGWKCGCHSRAAGVLHYITRFAVLSAHPLACVPVSPRASAKELLFHCGGPGCRRRPPACLTGWLPSTADCLLARQPHATLYALPVYLPTLPPALQTLYSSRMACCSPGWMSGAWEMPRRSAPPRLLFLCPLSHLPDSIHLSLAHCKRLCSAHLHLRCPRAAPAAFP